MTDETEHQRRVIKFWAPVYHSRTLHFQVRDRAEELGITGEMRWDIACGNEAEVEGRPDQLDAFEDHLRKKVDEYAMDVDDWRSEEEDATGEFDGFKTLFSYMEPEGDIVIPNWANQLNRIETDENEDDDGGAGG